MGNEDNLNPITTRDLKAQLDRIQAMQTAQTSTNSVSAEIKSQPFYESDPELWFITVESQFAARKITADKTMYNHVVANLNFKAANEVKSLLKEPYVEGKYYALKKALIDAFATSATERIKQLLSNEELGDRKPSLLLSKMQQLAENAVSDEFIKSLWIQRLPETARQILSASNDTLENLAKMADRVWESAESSRVHSINEKASNSSLSLELGKLIEKLTARIEKVESNNRKTRRDSTPHKGSRSRSKSNTKRDEETDELCWYHRTIGDDAKKCRPPCTKSKN